MSLMYFLRLLSIYTQVAQHLASTYGDKAFKIAKMSSLTGQRWPVLGKRLHQEFPYLEAEVNIHKTPTRVSFSRSWSK